MRFSSEFKPDWFSPPGDTIRQLINERGLTMREFSDQLNYSSDFTEKLLLGHLSLTRDIAQELSTIFGGSQNFWLNRERDYRDDLARYLKLEKETWVKNIPYADLVRSGAVRATKSIEERISNCIEFFGVSSFEEWKTIYGNKLAKAAFKKSQSFESVPESVLSWLRQGELLARDMNCSNWDSEKFSDALIKARSLSRIKDPEEFLPQLQDLFAESGVAVVICKAPQNCRVSGAVFPVNNKAVILLSFRYLSDDHFWFTLYHEAGHILLHGENGIFIEGADSISDKEEEEANRFAQNMLIPPEFQEEMQSLTVRDWKKLLKFSRKIGVSPGIVLGQLQHLQLIPHNQLNRIKVRYRWDGVLSPK